MLLMFFSDAYDEKTLLMSFQEKALPSITSYVTRNITIKYLSSAKVITRKGLIEIK